MLTLPLRRLRDDPTEKIWAERRNHETAFFQQYLYHAHTLEDVLWNALRRFPSGSSFEDKSELVRVFMVAGNLPPHFLSSCSPWAY